MTQIAAGVGLSTEENPVRAAVHAVREAREGVPHPDLALVFVAGKLAQSGSMIAAAVAESSGADIIFGCTALGIGTNTVTTKDGLGIMLVSGVAAQCTLDCIYLSASQCWTTAGCNVTGSSVALLQESDQ